MTELRWGYCNAWPGPWSLEPLSWSNEGKLGQDGEYIMRTCACVCRYEWRHWRKEDFKLVKGLEETLLQCAHGAN